MTHPCHKDTAQTNNAVTANILKGKTMQRGAGQYRVPDPTRRRGITTRTTPAIQRDHHANKRGAPTHGRGVSNTAALHLPCHPTSPCHPTIHDGHPLHHCEGGADRGYPTTRTAQTDTHPHTPHTWQVTVCGMTAVLSRYALGVEGMGRTHRVGRTGSSTPPPFHTPHTDKDGYHPLIYSTHSCSHNQRSIMINEQQTIVQSTMINQ